MRLLALVFCLLSGPVAAAELTVFAAASLKGALDEVASAWEQKSGDSIRIAYAGSVALARQVIYGAPADIFISANGAWMDQAVKAQTPIERVDLLTNALALVGQAPADVTFTEDGLRHVLGADRIATGFVNAVPAGIYAREALTHYNLWPELRPNLLEAENVRAALAWVVRGEVPFGIVYLTDVAAADGLTLLGVFPAQSHGPIRYPAAQFTPKAGPFMAYLQSEDARAVFNAHGFGMP